MRKGGKALPKRRTRQRGESGNSLAMLARFNLPAEMQDSLYAPSLTTFQNTENRFYFFTTARAPSPPGGGEGTMGREKIRFWGACGAQKTRFPYVPARFARCALRAQREAPFEGAATFLASGVANRVAPRSRKVVAGKAVSGDATPV